MKIGIVIPAKNEEKRIGKMLQAYAIYYQKKDKIDKNKYELLVVINNTKDSTEKIVLSYKKKFKNISYITLNLGGKGYGVIQGFKYFIKKNYDLVGFVDADLSTSPEDFNDLILYIGNNSGIIGNRWSSKSTITKKQSLIRRFASRIFNLIVKLLFFMNYQDTQCGAKLFKVKDIAKVVPNVFITQWAFDVNILYLCKKYNLKISEFPTVWEDQDFSGVDTIRTSLKMFSGIVRLRLIHSPFSFIIRAYDTLTNILKLNHTLIK